MNFHVGDTVMHWNHGIGKITAQEERNLGGESKLYFVVNVQDFNVWVPADELVSGRLRVPTPAGAFEKLFAILRGPAQTLPVDRHERKTQLHDRMSSGTAESICQVVRDLTAQDADKRLNDDDREMLKRARKMLLGEWGYSLRIPPMLAEDHLSALLKQRVVSRGSDQRSAVS